MQFLGTGYNIPWLPQPNEISLILDETLPPRHLITSALALAFHEGGFLMTNLHQRGWDIPFRIARGVATAVGARKSADV